MTAREQIANYESTLREYTNFAVRGVKKVCKTVGARESATESERRGQEMMAEDLKSCCESVTMEEFISAPRGFLAWINIGVACGVLSALAFNLGYALIAAFVLGLGIAGFFVEFFLYKKFYDPFFPKKTSQNLVAVRKPEGEVKRRLILCGHSDSAYEFSFTYWGHKYFKSVKLLTVMIIFAAIILVGGAVICLLGVLFERGGLLGLGNLGQRAQWLRVLGYVYAAACVPLCAEILFKSWKKVVEGANDNLSGCYTAMAAAKLLGGQGLRLKNTELVILCSGCEESGLRGAKAFVAAHKEEYSDVETAMIALDTMRDYEHIGIYVTDIHGRVKHSPAVAALMKEAAKTAGHDLKYHSLFFGASDAAAATQAGIPAALLAAMDPAPAPYYHTRLDTHDNLDPKTIEACLDITLEIAHLYDTAGLAPFQDAVVKVGQ